MLFAVGFHSQLERLEDHAALAAVEQVDHLAFELVAVTPEYAAVPCTLDHSAFSVRYALLSPDWTTLEKDYSTLDVAVVPSFYVVAVSVRR